MLAEQPAGHGGGLVGQPLVHVDQGPAADGGGQQQGRQQLLGGRAPDVAAVVLDGRDEVTGEPVRLGDGGQLAQRVPPPGLLGVADVLRVEGPDRLAGLGRTQLGGLLPALGLVRGQDDGAGRRQGDRDGEGGGLTRTRRHDRDGDVLPGAEQLGGAGLGAKPAEQQPDVVGGQVLRLGTCQRGPQPQRPGSGLPAEHRLQVDAPAQRPAGVVRGRRAQVLAEHEQGERTQHHRGERDGEARDQPRVGRRPVRGRAVGHDADQQGQPERRRVPAGAGHERGEAPADPQRAPYDQPGRGDARDHPCRCISAAASGGGHRARHQSPDRCVGVAVPLI